MTLPESLRRRLADLHLGAEVHSSDGRHVGSLHRVVVDQEGWDPHQIVVKESIRFNGHFLAQYAGLMTDEVVVPMSAIARASHERVDLSLSASEVRLLPPYLSYRWAPFTADTRTKAVGEAVEGDIGILLGAPPPPREIETASKASGEIEIRKDESVMVGHEGTRLGTVRDVLYDDGEMVGVVVHRGHDDVLVQVRFLERSDDGALFVRMTGDDVARLQPFRP